MALISMSVNVCVFSSLFIMLSLMDVAMFWIVSSSFRSANNAFFNVCPSKGCILTVSTPRSSKDVLALDFRGIVSSGVVTPGGPVSRVFGSG